jgi:hypothetical protein
MRKFPVDLRQIAKYSAHLCNSTMSKHANYHKVPWGNKPSIIFSFGMFYSEVRLLNVIFSFRDWISYGWMNRFLPTFWRNGGYFLLLYIEWWEFCHRNWNFFSVPGRRWLKESGNIETCSSTSAWLNDYQIIATTKVQYYNTFLFSRKMNNIYVSEYVQYENQNSYSQLAMKKE